MHMCVSKLTTIGSDNGLSPGRRQAIIWTNAVILLIRPLGTSFSEILLKMYIFIQENAFENALWKTSAILFPPQFVNSLRPCFCQTSLAWSMDFNEKSFDVYSYKILSLPHTTKSGNCSDKIVDCKTFGLVRC